MSLDEYEAIRLADLEGLYQEQAASRMNISRQTFGRIIESAHRKVADVLVNGKALKIEGGDVSTGRDEADPVSSVPADIQPLLRNKGRGDMSALQKASVESHYLKKENMMKIALPACQNQVDEHFGHCEYFTVFTINDEE